MLLECLFCKHKWETNKKESTEIEEVADIKRPYVFIKCPQCGENNLCTNEGKYYTKEMIKDQCKIEKENKIKNRSFGNFEVPMIDLKEACFKTQTGRISEIFDDEPAPYNLHDYCCVSYDKETGIIEFKGTSENRHIQIGFGIRLSDLLKNIFS